MYQVKWKDSDETTWEPFENVSHLTHLLSKFTQANSLSENEKTWDQSLGFVNNEEEECGADSTYYPTVAIGLSQNCEDHEENLQLDNDAQDDEEIPHTKQNKKKAKKPKKEDKVKAAVV